MEANTTKFFFPLRDKATFLLTLSAMARVKPIFLHCPAAAAAAAAAEQPREDDEREENSRKRDGNLLRCGQNHFHQVMPANVRHIRLSNEILLLVPSKLLPLLSARRQDVREQRFQNKSIKNIFCLFLK